MPDTPASFADVLRYELKAVRARREAVRNAALGLPAPAAPPADDLKDKGTEELRRAALDDGLVGLALSGGGVRSATFGLGFLQGLSRLNLLTAVDYLSTVSGGGYVGGWLTAWIHREGQRLETDKKAAAGATANVEKQLHPERKVEAQADRLVQVGDESRPLEEVLRSSPVLDDEPEPVYHLRAYSNYLAPRPGWLSGDRWTLYAIYTRNTLVNLLILVPVAFAVVLLAYGVVWCFAQPGGESGSVVPAAAAAGLALLALVQLGRSLARLVLRPAAADEKFRLGWLRHWGVTVDGNPGRWRFWAGVVAPTVAAAVLAAWIFSPGPTPLAAWAAVGTAAAGPWSPDLRYPYYREVHDALDGMGVPPWSSIALTFGLLGVVAGVLNAGRRPDGTRVGGSFWFPVVLGLALGALWRLLLAYALWPLAAYPAAVATLGPPLLLLAIVVAGFVESAVHSKRLSAHEREWRARLAASLAFVAVTWLVFFGTVFFLPAGIRHLNSVLGSAAVDYWAVAGWVVTTVGGLLAAKSPRTGDGAAREPSWVLGWIAAIGPVVFLVGLLALLGVLAGRVLDGRFAEHHVFDAAKPADGLSLGKLVGLVVACGGWALLLSRLTDVNVFSMHALYGNRLVRGYLGASRRKVYATDEHPAGRLQWVHDGKGEWGQGLGGAPTGVGGPVRRENPVTGFDGSDDIPLRELRFADPPPGTTPYTGPYHLIGTALNLVAGDELAVQDRRASSFVLSPGYCGSDETGYAQTPATGTGEPPNLTLGRAMTISGAAADPNMSTFNSPAVTALMTVFNVRLGWWMENPRYPADGKTWAAGPPKGGMLASLARELLGLTHAHGEYVHLSDGGHFDNTGVYELVRRRCRYVVQVDAGADPDDRYEDLGQLVRRVRADFGIRIEIDPTPTRRGPDRLSPWHVAVGRIRYDDVDADALAGTLVYVRPTRTGDEPADVRQYADAHPDYPHRTTADQFFDNDQFEAYRMLGEHVAVAVFEDATRVARKWPPKARHGADDYRRGVRGLFAEVHSRWYPPPTGVEAGLQRAGRDCAALMRQFRRDERLARLVRDMYPELPLDGSDPRADGAAAADRSGDAELLATNQLLDVMERAWQSVRLATHYDHPVNRGWMNAFRRWTTSAAFRRAWPVIRGEYGKDFVRFCERSLNLPRVRALPVEIEPTEYALRVAVLDGRLAVELSAAGTDERPTTRLDVLDREFAREWGSGLGWIERKRERAARDGQKCSATVPTPVFQQLAGDGDRILSKVVEQVGRDRAAGSYARAWLLHMSEMRPGGEFLPIDHLRDHPVGLLAVVPRGASDGVWNYEILFWVRPAYRSLGLGRSALEDEGARREHLYVTIRDDLRRLHDTDEVHLWAHYPAGWKTQTERPQRGMWLNFCHDYGFRRHDPPPTGAGPEPPWVSVRYEVPKK